MYTLFTSSSNPISCPLDKTLARGRLLWLLLLLQLLLLLLLLLLLNITIKTEEYYSRLGYALASSTWLNHTVIVN